MTSASLLVEKGNKVVLAGDDEESYIMNKATKEKIPVNKEARVNARGAGSCDQVVRPRHVRGVGDGDEEQKAEESVGEHDVEMQGGPDEEIIEMGRNDDEQDEQEDHEAGMRKVRKLHDPMLPSEKGVREHYCSGHMPYRSWCHHCVRRRGRDWR